MPTREMTITDIRAGAPQLDHNVPAKLVAWKPMGKGDDGAPLEIDVLVHYRERAFEVTGDFDGGELVFEGTNGGEQWTPLMDPHGVPLTITWTGIYQVDQTVMQIRPRINGGNDKTKLLVTALIC